MPNKTKHAKLPVQYWGIHSLYHIILKMSRVNLTSLTYGKKEHNDSVSRMDNKQMPILRWSGCEIIREADVIMLSGQVT